MRKAEVFVDKKKAGVLVEILFKRHYRFIYEEGYHDQPVSLTMPTSERIFDFDEFPPFFEGLLPEGMMLDSLLKIAKIDRDDLFKQLVLVGRDTIGNVSIRESI